MTTRGLLRNAALALATMTATLTAGAQAFSADGKPLVIYVSSNPVGVNDFLMLGKIGTDRIAKELGGTSKTFESTDPTTQRQNLEAAAKEGADVVVAITFEFNDILPQVAAQYPNVKFLQIDSCPSKMLPNIYCAVFREYETNFLAGAEAALTSETGKVGAIGALDIPFIHRYNDAFLAGAKHVKPEIETAANLWIGGDNPFSDPARGQQRATVMLSEDVDRVLAAASGSNGGIFKAMADFPGAAAFGVDINQCKQSPGHVMDNVEKLTDVAVETGVRDILKGTRGQVVALGLKENGMTLTSFKPDVDKSECLIAKYPEVIDKVKALKEEIIAGKVVVADPMKLDK
ncbi:BMP family ABC transporter substrate-binding protein [Rhizobium rhizosphaerae]|uniref:BMP family ABC transporter substrate-binding protein n=1 Tax=Xaviernesmea rhizosphaerae TaxID=1672749 RepID=A0A1Q9AM32_9HYPH|nr:BMP family ABC transporter substrate-binding protein [Xaviernesmea rhizosphaerae]OLP56470.1 BMP family ABC transporter substrate-binding protein [Xaviernesmea rhizosphaerae]